MANETVITVDPVQLGKPFPASVRMNDVRTNPPKQRTRLPYTSESPKRSRDEEESPVSVISKPTSSSAPLYDPEVPTELEMPKTFVHAIRLPGKTFKKARVGVAGKDFVETGEYNLSTFKAAKEEADRAIRNTETAFANNTDLRLQLAHKLYIIGDQTHSWLVLTLDNVDSALIQKAFNSLHTGASDASMAVYIDDSDKGSRSIQIPMLFNAITLFKTPLDEEDAYVTDNSVCYHFVFYKFGDSRTVIDILLRTLIMRWDKISV